MNINEGESNKDLKEIDSKQDYKEYKETGLQEENEQIDAKEQEIQEVDEKKSEPEDQEVPPVLYSYNGSNAQDNIVWVMEKDTIYFSSGNEIVEQTTGGKQN